MVLTNTPGKNSGGGLGPIAEGQPLNIVGGKYSGKRAVARICKKGDVTTDKMVNVTIDQGQNQKATDTRVRKENVVLTTSRGWSQLLRDRLLPHNDLPSQHKSPLAPSCGHEKKPRKDSGNVHKSSTPNRHGGSHLPHEMCAMRKQFYRVLQLMAEEKGIEAPQHFFNGAWHAFLGLLDEEIVDLQQLISVAENWDWDAAGGMPPGTTFRTDM